MENISLPYHLPPLAVPTFGYPPYLYLSRIKHPLYPFILPGEELDELHLQRQKFCEPHARIATKAHTELKSSLKTAIRLSRAPSRNF